MLTPPSRRPHLRRFADELRQADPAPDRIALAIAGMVHPELDVDHYLRRIDGIAAQVGAALATAAAGQERANAFLRVIHEELGYRGNVVDYYDPRNSLLDEVLDRHLGLPILLCVLCMAVGRRLGLAVHGLGFPGHFMARYQDEAGAWILDPFHGELMAPDDVDDYLARKFRQAVVLPASARRPVTALELSQRILNNLRNVYMLTRSYELTVRVLDYLVIVMPSHAPYWQERGLLQYEIGEYEAASRDLRRYFYLTDRLSLALEMESAQTEAERTALSPEEQHMVRLFRQAESTLVRVN